MEAILVVFILVFNLAISFWNAYITGKSWVETKHAGGWSRFMSWMGAIMSALGFTWCYLIVAGFVLSAINWINEQELELIFNVGYLLVIPGILFSGLMIMINSWANAYRERTLGSVEVAGYNTFANIYNTYNALSDVPSAFNSVLDFFTGDSDEKSGDSSRGLMLILLVVLLLCAGILTTATIIKRVAASDEPLSYRY